jgi:hypothetical protein
MSRLPSAGQLLLATKADTVTVDCWRSLDGLMCVIAVLCLG